MFPDKPDYKSDHIILDQFSYANDLKDFSFTFLELKKFNKGIHELKNMTDKWTYYLKHGDDTKSEDLQLIIASDLILQKHIKKLSHTQLGVNKSSHNMKD